LFFADKPAANIVSLREGVNGGRVSEPRIEPRVSNEVRKPWHLEVEVVKVWSQ
jgi:hypothetical protein